MNYKRYAYGVSVVCFILGAWGILGEFKVPKSFGKTHFIVGYKGEPVAQISESLDTSAPSSFSADHNHPSEGVHSVLFSPDDNVQQELISLIEQEQASIKMAIFMLTTKEIVNALLQAHARGVKITIITDSMCVKERWSKVTVLTKAGICVYEYKPSSAQTRMNDLMHHKFVIFGKNHCNKTLVWTGSFNFTRSAQVNNQENVVILNDAKVVAKFNTQFKRLKQRSKKL